MDAVKLEGGRGVRRHRARASCAPASPCRATSASRPQSVNRWAATRCRAAPPTRRAALLDDALALEDAGCFSLVLESVPDRVAAAITERLHIPTIGIGAGPAPAARCWCCTTCSASSTASRRSSSSATPSWARQLRAAVVAYRDDVRRRAFPGRRALLHHARRGVAGLPARWSARSCRTRWTARRVVTADAGPRPRPRLRHGRAGCLFGARLAPVGRARHAGGHLARGPGGAPSATASPSMIADGRWSRAGRRQTASPPVPAADVVPCPGQGAADGHRRARRCAARARAGGLVVTLQNGLGQPGALRGRGGAGPRRRRGHHRGGRRWWARAASAPTARAGRARDAARPRGRRGPGRRAAAAGRLRREVTARHRARRSGGSWRSTARSTRSPRCCGVPNGALLEDPARPRQLAARRARGRRGGGRARASTSARTPRSWRVEVAERDGRQPLLDAAGRGARRARPRSTR